MTLRALHGVPAPAKLNLFLHVVGRRDDGYHLLESLFVLIDWADTLHFERRDDGRLARHDLSAALPADDLCLRAARALQAAAGSSLGADISIDKQVPWGAGMGGGSSDAASTLLALNRLWGLNWSRRRLAQIGLALGADVPFFIGGCNAFVQGVGERLTPVALTARHFMVIKPPAALETRAVFAHPLLGRSKRSAILAGSFEGSAGQPAVPVAQADEMARAGFGRNDLQLAGRAICPEVAQAAAWLEARYGNSRMTGSGSAVFARLESENGTAAPPLAMPAPAGSQGSAPAALTDLPAGWVARNCRSLQHHPLAAWAEGAC